MKALIVVLLLTVFLEACRREPVIDDPIIVLDDWWSYDYAKNACQLGHLICQDDARGDVTAFENKFITEFGVNPDCKGLKAVRFGGPMAKSDNKAIVSERHWSLSFNIMPDERIKQNWQLIDRNNKRYAESETTPEIAAQKVCAFIKNKGGQTE